MRDLLSIVQKLHELSLKASSIDEQWDRLTYQGVCEDGLLSYLAETYVQLDSQIRSGFTFLLDGDGVDADVIRDRESIGDIPREWTFTFNKNQYANREQDPSSPHIIFFVSYEKFKSWVSAQSAFKIENNPFHAFKSTEFYINASFDSFGGPRVSVHGIVDEGQHDLGQKFNFPSQEDVLEHVHLLHSSPATIDPLPFVLTWGDISGETAKPFRRLLAASLSASLVDSFHGDASVVLHGLKRQVFRLIDTGDDLTERNIASLIDVVRWVYQTDERPDTRKKLLADRITLDALETQSLVRNFSRLIEAAFTQAKEQYTFVINNRKDEYARELRDLLKDVRTQADLYAEKTRSIVNGLLRDAIGALLLISLTMFARISAAHISVGNIDAIYLFKALSIYFVISFGLQAKVSCSDISLSGSELDHWANAARHYLSEDMVNTHLKDSLKPRADSFWSNLRLIGFLYLALAIFMWFLPELMGS